MNVIIAIDSLQISMARHKNKQTWAEFSAIIDLPIARNQFGVSVGLILSLQLSYISFKSFNNRNSVADKSALRSDAIRNLFPANPLS